MRLLICGPRDFPWSLQDKVLEAIRALPEKPEVIIEGGAKGVDTVAKVMAIYEGVTWLEYPADWKKHGKGAGPIRNKQMLEEGKPDLVMAFKPVSGWTPGTANMVSQAQKAGVAVQIVEYKETEDDSNQRGE